MGHMKDALENLRQLEQDQGWVDRKVGECQLVQDALPKHEAKFIEDLAARRENGDRSLKAGEAKRVQRVHHLHALPAIRESVAHETAAERAERAKALQAKKGAARAPEANEDPEEQQKIAAAAKKGGRR